MARSAEEKKMEQIAALLERAEDENNSPAERETAARMAERLGSKYSIDFAVARLRTAQRHERDDQIVTRSIEIPYKSGNTRDQGWIALMLELAHACGIYIVWKSNIITVYGSKFDVEFAISLFHVLVTDQEVHALRYAKKHAGDKSVRTLKDSFRYGYRKRVRVRIESLRSERMAEIDHQEGLSSGSTSLALRDRNAEMFSQFSDAVERENVQVKEDDYFHVSNLDKKSQKEGDQAGATVKLVADKAIKRGKREIK